MMEIHNGHPNFGLAIVKFHGDQNSVALVI